MKDALDSFLIILDCLLLYDQKKQHMFKPIAGQLRILYCDRNSGKDNSLLSLIYPDLKLMAFQKHEFKKEHDDLKIKVVAYDNNGHNVTNHGFLIQPACFIITQKSNGHQSANFDLSSPPMYLSLQEWCDQLVCSDCNLTVKGIIRSVADKGGGSHVDVQDNPELSLMKKTGPAGVGLHILFVIALARYTIKFAKQFAIEWIEKYPDLFDSVKKDH
ncbi:MAG: hypothetical protein HW406_1661 [Candidatus Brocadiaceae bacterium]|nr:hypothetical protein [Candidatus Brocadiaceae bacterium]